MGASIYKYISLGPFQKLDLVEAPKTIVSNTTSVVKNQNFCLSKGGGFETPRALEDLEALYLYMGTSIWELLYGSFHLGTSIWELLYASLYSALPMRYQCVTNALLSALPQCVTPLAIPQTKYVLFKTFAW